MKKQSRRRFVHLVAATSGIGLAGILGTVAVRKSDDDPLLHRWDGTALGADASLLIHDTEPGRAEHLVDLARAEIVRLEAAFSLHRPDSALVRLNRQGYLVDPPAELVELLERSIAWSEASNGAFDVTVQPLWSLYRDYFAAANADPAGPDAAAVGAARKLVDYRAMDISPDRIRLAHPGMAVTLNGIAQGDITDRVADLLRAAGLNHTLINLGEFRALGEHPSGRPWKVGIRDPYDHGALVKKVDLNDRAIATSAVTGTVFDADGRHHHLFDPAAGRPSRGLASASVIARYARDADAFSTALLASSVPSVPLEASRLGVEHVVTVAADGKLNEWRAMASSHRVS